MSRFLPNSEGEEEMDDTLLDPASEVFIHACGRRIDPQEGCFDCQLEEAYTVDFPTWPLVVFGISVGIFGLLVLSVLMETWEIWGL